MSRIPCRCDKVTVGGTPMQHYHDTTTGVTDLVSLDGEPTQTHTKSATPSDNLNKAVEEILKHFERLSIKHQTAPQKSAARTINRYETATQALTTLIDEEVEKTLNKQRGMQKITAYIPIKQGGIDDRLK